MHTLGYTIHTYPAVICMPSMVMASKPQKMKGVVMTIEDKLDISCQVDVEPSLNTLCCNVSRTFS